MTPEKIIEQLSEFKRGHFPEAALRAAISQQESITPLLLQHLQTQTADLAKCAQENSMLNLYSVYLLAQFREQQAYPLIVRLVSGPGESPFDILGDTITEDLGRILASVFDGNTSLLETLIESDDINEFVRSAALRSLSCLRYNGQISPEWLLDYCTNLYRGRLKKEEAHVWDALSKHCLNMGFTTLLPDIEKTYIDQLTLGEYSTFEFIRERMNSEPFSKSRMKDLMHQEAELITDIIAELRNWASFRPEKPRPNKSDYSLPVVQRVNSESTKTGRNDPCPCGSGKKFKKCCMQ